MRKIFIGVFAAALAAHAASALADGALAIGTAPGGVAESIVVNIPSIKQVSAKALEACRNAPGVNADARSACQVVSPFHWQCAAVALAPADGSAGLGWGIAPSTVLAKQQAMEGCAASAGARGGECAISIMDCDGR